MPNSKATTLKSPFPPQPVLWFLVLFNLAVAATVAAGVGFHGTQRVLISAGMGVVALGAGAGLAKRRGAQA